MWGSLMFLPLLDYSLTQKPGQKVKETSEISVNEGFTKFSFPRQLIFWFRKHVKMADFKNSLINLIDY